MTWTLLKFHQSVRGLYEEQGQPGHPIWSGSTLLLPLGSEGQWLLWFYQVGAPNNKVSLTSMQSYLLTLFEPKIFTTLQTVWLQGLPARLCFGKKELCKDRLSYQFVQPCHGPLPTGYPWTGFSSSDAWTGRPSVCTGPRHFCSQKGLEKAQNEGKRGKMKILFVSTINFSIYSPLCIWRKWIT